MLAERFEKIAERRTGIARAAQQQIVADHDAQSVHFRLAHTTGLLADRLAQLPEESSDEALGHALEALGRGLGAERVTFYEPGPAACPSRFERRHSWHSDTSTLSSQFESEKILDLDRLPSRGSELAQGNPLRAARPDRSERSHDRIALLSFRDRKRGLFRVAPTVYLPCRSRTGLIGVFSVEAGPGTPDWSKDTLLQANTIGSITAQFLERHRLAQERDAARSRRGHDERLQTLGRIASSVAHDFNNLLTAILGNVDLLELDLMEAEQASVEIDEIRTAATRAAGLVEQVLRFGRTHESGMQRVNIEQRISELEGLMRRVAGQDLCVDIAIDPLLPEVEVDPTRLERAILNLVSNARDAVVSAGVADGRFTLSASVAEIDLEGFDGRLRPIAMGPSKGVSPGSYVRLTARDNGCGMDESLRELIFEPFFTTKSEGLGTGLGLSATTELLREAGGAVAIESGIGKGTTFHLYLGRVPKSGPGTNPA